MFIKHLSLEQHLHITYKIHIDFKDMITNDLVIRVSKTLLNCSIISSSNMWAIVRLLSCHILNKLVV